MWKKRPPYNKGSDFKFEKENCEQKVIDYGTNEKG